MQPFTNQAETTFMRLRRKLFRGSSAFSASVISQATGRLLLLGILASGCGQASPQGLDDASAKPGFGVLRIYPQNPQIETGHSVQFVAKDAWDKQIDGPVSWSATGGVITRDGLYTAGASPGKFSVTAKSHGSTATQNVTVVKSLVSSPPPDDPSDPPDEDPSDDPDPTGSIFADGFERGDFTTWSGAALIGDPSWNGSGSGGAHIGNGYITNERVRSGKLAWKALVNPTADAYGKENKSSLERWKGMGALEFHISAWYFIPTDYPAVWSNIMQIKATGSGWSHKPVAIALRRDRTLAVFSGILNKNVLTTATKLPVGRWFNLKGRFLIDNNGLVEVWLDGNKIASVRTDTKDNDFAYPGVGNYVAGSDYQVTSHIYIDDVEVTP